MPYYIESAIEQICDNIVDGKNYSENDILNFLNKKLDKYLNDLFE